MTKLSMAWVCAKKCVCKQLIITHITAVEQAEQISFYTTYTKCEGFYVCL